MSPTRPGRRLLVVAVVIALALAGPAPRWPGRATATPARPSSRRSRTPPARAPPTSASTSPGARSSCRPWRATEGIVEDRPSDGRAPPREPRPRGRLGFTAGDRLVRPLQRGAGLVGAAATRHGHRAGAARRPHPGALERRGHSSRGLPASTSSPSPAIVVAVPTRGRGGAHQRRPGGRRSASSASSDMAASPAPVRGGRTAIVDRSGQLIVAPGLRSAVARRRRPPGAPGAGRGGRSGHGAGGVGRRRARPGRPHRTS